MGDMREGFDFMKELSKEKREKNMTNFNSLASHTGWTQHAYYHWSYILNGKRLDYWPSKNKFQYNGKVMCGDVHSFIRKRLKVKND